MARSASSSNRRPLTGDAALWILLGLLIAGVSITIVAMPVKVSFGIVAGLALCALILIRAEFGVITLILIFAIPLELNYDVIKVRALNPFNVLFFVTLLSVFHHKFIKQEVRFPHRSDLHAPLLAFLIMIFIGMMRTQEAFLDRIVYLYFKQIEYYMIFYFVFYTLTKENVKRYIGFLMLGLLILSLFSIQEHLQQVAQEHEKFQYNVRTAVLGFNSNNLGIFLAQSALLPLLLAFAKKSRSRKIPYFIVFIVAVAALCVTYSRTAYGAFAAVALFMAFLMKGNRLFMAAVIAIGIVFAPGSVKERVLFTVSESSADEFQMDESAENHLEVFANTLRLLEREPWVALIGGGVGYYEANYSGGNTHSTYLHLINSYGVLGLVIMFWLAGKMVVVCMRVYKYDYDILFRNLALGGFLGVVAMMVGGIFHDHYSGFHVFYLYAAMAVVAWRDEILNQKAKTSLPY